MTTKRTKTTKGNRKLAAKKPIHASLRNELLASTAVLTLCAYAAAIANQSSSSMPGFLELLILACWLGSLVLLIRAGIEFINTPEETHWRQRIGALIARTAIAMATLTLGLTLSP